MTNAFGQFIRRLHSTSVKEKFATVLVDIVSDIFLKTINFEFLPYPVEMIMQIVSTMRQHSEMYAQLPNETLSRFIYAVIRVTRDLLQSDKFVRNEPISPMEGANRADLCFQSVKALESDSGGGNACDKEPHEKNTGNGAAAAAAAAASEEGEQEPAEQPTTAGTGAGADNNTEDGESFKPYWSVSQLPFTRLDVYESSSQLRYYEEMVGTLLQEVLSYCMNNKTLVAELIREYPAAIEDLLDVLSSCSFFDRDYDSLFEERRFLNCWRPVSVADYALRLLLLFSDLCGDQQEHLIGLTVECLKRCVDAHASSSQPKLSKPVAFAVVYMLLIPHNQRVFIQFGGHLVVSAEIKNCINASLGDWTVPECSVLVQKLSAMATQVSYAGDYPVAPRRPPAAKVEGLFNYAPICSITSSSSMAHQLSALLAAAPPHRRARTANWSYHFYPGAEWLDLTLTLPYQIMLHEVHIRPHPPTLNTGPSAVQLEVCTDASFTTWKLVAPKMCTLGFSKIRIPAQSFPYPINALRIYLRRAPDSTNLGLSQILVLGNAPYQALSLPLSVGSDFRQWLAILDRLCTMEERSIWHYAPDLPSSLVILFLSRPLQTGIYRRVASLLVRIDNDKAKPYTIVELILSYVAKRRYVSPQSLDWLPEVIFTLCSNAAEGTQIPLHVKHQIQVFRQRQLLLGIKSILDSPKSFNSNQQEAVAVLMWSTACAIWNNVSSESMHFDTTAVCVEIGPKLIPRLCEVACDLSPEIDYEDMMRDSASWLLCSIIRCAPLYLTDALSCMDFDEPFDNQCGMPSRSAMRVVAFMCQSATAVHSLLSGSILQGWIDCAIKLCQVIDEKNTYPLTNIVDCIRSLCSVEEVVNYLDSAHGSTLFNPLITYIARLATHQKAGHFRVDLENATIGLICRCIAVGRGHRERISNILCSLLKNEKTLNGAVQQMILKCVLDDETITVKLVDDKAPPFFLPFTYKGRVMHPLFGCCRRERVVTISLYSAFRDILPPYMLSANIGRRNASSNSKDIHECTTQDHAPFNMEYAAPNKHNDGSSTMKEPGSKKLLVTSLMCDSYSARRPVSGAWYVGQFIDAIRNMSSSSSSSASSSSSFNTGSIERDVNDEMSTNKPKPMDQNRMAAVSNFTDGYFTLLLKLNTSTIEELRRAVEDELPPFEIPSKVTPEHISTLQHFARAGGLAILAQHLQLYQPSSSVSANTPNPRGGGPCWPKESPLSNSNYNYVMQPLITEPNGYIPVYFSVPEGGGGGNDEEIPSSSMAGYGMSVPPTYPDETNLTYDHDFEFIDMPQSNAGFDFVQKFYSPITNQSPYTTVMPNSQKCPPNSRVSASSTTYSHSTSLSPHVVLAFSVLLRLDGYAELLVTYDRVRSKRLLRLAMGVGTSEQGKTRSMKCEDICIENDTLALLPFIVLERLYRLQHPETPAGRALRNASIKLGVLDILLVCLAHYSHQKHKAEPIRPISLRPAPDSVRLAAYLLRSSAQLEAMRTEASANASGSGYDDRVTMHYGSTMAPPNQSQQQHSFWAKGTGFGSGTTQQQWNVDEHVMRRKLDEQTVTHLLRVLSSYIFPSPNWRRARYSRSHRSTTASASDSSCVKDSCSLTRGRVSPIPVARSSSRSVHSDLCSPTAEAGCEEWTLDASVVELLSRSCLLPTICAYLRNDSVLDISRHVEVYEAVVYLVAALARCPAKLNDQGQDALAELLSQCDSGVSLYTMLHKLHGYIRAYLSKLKIDSATLLQAEEKPEEPHVAAAVSDGGTTKSSEGGLTKLSQLILRTCSFVSRRVGGDSTNAENQVKPVLTADEKYIEIMRALQFQSIPFFSETARIPYHYYESSMGAVGAAATLGRRTRRLAQEVVTLSNSLPLSSSSSVFVRCAEERLDVMKVLITGPSDTPYMNGCFEFDVWFPLEYPDLPMHVNLETTGNHTVRFNPNLYNDGKVCLSVLNTWHGRPEERWNPATSSFLQVIVSMQSLILVSEPYFNEPGYERSKCTQAGQQASRDYDANIRQATVRWAMLEMIRHPPVAFRDVIMKHFWLKRAEIIAQITEWIRETNAQIEEQRGSARTLQAHLVSLKRHFTALHDEFTRMERPEGLDDDGGSDTAIPAIPSQQHSTDLLNTTTATATATPKPSTTTTKKPIPNVITISINTTTHSNADDDDTNSSSSAAGPEGSVLVPGPLPAPPAAPTTLPAPPQAPTSTSNTLQQQQQQQQQLPVQTAPFSGMKVLKL